MLMRHIEAAIRCVPGEGLHGECVAINVILFAQLHHGSAFGDAAPRCVEQVSGERIEDDIDSISIGAIHELGLEVDGSGVVNVFFRYRKGILQELFLGFLSYRGVYRGSNRLAYLDGCYTQASRSRMDQYAISMLEIR